MKDGRISQSQTFIKDGKRFIYITELLRVYGEPMQHPETETAGTRDGAKTAGDVTGGAEVVALLRQQVVMLEERAKRAEDQADRYEIERDELRGKYEEVLTRLLPPPAPPAPETRPGWLRRVFGG